MAATYAAYRLDPQQLWMQARCTAAAVMGLSNTAVAVTSGSATAAIMAMAAVAGPSGKATAVTGGSAHRGRSYSQYSSVAMPHHRMYPIEQNNSLWTRCRKL